MQFQWKVSFSPGDSILTTQHHPQDEGHKWFQIAPFKWYLMRDTLILRGHALGLQAQIQLFYFWRYRLWHMSVAAPFSCSWCPPVLWRSAHASKASAMQQRTFAGNDLDETVDLSYNQRDRSFYCDEKVCLDCLHSTSSPLCNGFFFVDFCFQ